MHDEGHAGFHPRLVVDSKVARKIGSNAEPMATHAHVRRPAEIAVTGGAEAIVLLLRGGARRRAWHGGLLAGAHRFLQQSFFPAHGRRRPADHRGAAELRELSLV